MKSLKSLCENLLLLAELATKHVENIDSWYVKGDFSSNIEKRILEIISLSDQFDYDRFTLKVDGDLIALSDFAEYVGSNHQSVEFALTFDKKTFIQNLYSGSGDVDEILFISLDVFENLEINGLGLKNPLIESTINKKSITRIQVHGLKQAFGGPQLLVTPIDFNEEPSDWLTGSKLPTTEAILKHVHILSNENIN